MSSNNPCVPSLDQLYHIELVNSGMCLDYTNLSTSDGDPFHYETLSGGIYSSTKPETTYWLNTSPCSDNNKSWYLIRVPGLKEEYYVMRDEKSGHLMGAASSASGSVVVGLDPSVLPIQRIAAGAALDGVLPLVSVWQINSNAGGSSCSINAVNGNPALDPDLYDDSDGVPLSPTNQTLTSNTQAGATILDTYQGANNQAWLLTQ